MRKRIFVLAALATTLLIAPANAQSSEQLRVCTGETEATWDLRIINCTAVIESKQETRDNRVLAYVHRGFIFYHVNREARRAIADFTEAIRLNPDFGPAYRRRSEVLRDEGELDLAIADFSELIRIYPIEAEFYYERALLWKDKGDHERAVADLTEAIRFNARHAGAYGFRGRLLVDMGELDRAIANYTDAIAAADPDEFPSPANNHLADRGFVRFFRGDFSASAADLHKAITEAPYSLSNELRTPLHYVAQVRSGKDDTAELAAQVERWKRAPPVFELFLGRRSPEEVLKATASSVRNGCEAQFFVGQWHLIRGNRKEARERFQAATSHHCRGIDITNPGAHFELKRMGP